MSNPKPQYLSACEMRLETEDCGVSRLRTLDLWLQLFPCGYGSGIGCVPGAHKNTHTTKHTLNYTLAIGNMNYVNSGHSEAAILHTN